MKWKQKTAKLDTSFSSFVKIIKRAISKLEIYSALKLPFCCSYFFYLWIFNSKKKGIINRKLLWLNYLISSSIVLLPVNAKVELPTRSCRMCTFYWNLTWLWKTDTYNSIKMAQWTLNTYLQRVCTVEIFIFYKTINLKKKNFKFSKITLINDNVNKFLNCF